MQSTTTIQGPQRPTRSPIVGTLDFPRRALWAVELSVVGGCHRYTWRGWARDSQDAKRMALDDGRRTWRGFTFCVHGVFEVLV